MATDPERLLRPIRRLAARPAADSDDSLLGRFVRCRDEAAFAALVARYGGMVLGACRRVLGNDCSAEDCTQAAFLVLARKAGALRPESLPAWLHGTARRLALRSRRADLRRGRREAQCALATPASSRPDPLSELTARELLSLLEEEIERLPERYRLPIILCCLEGLSQEEAARRLGWKTGSLKGRLERGRKRLHARLGRRGLTLAAALAAVEASRGACSGLSAPLAGATVRTALAFAAGGARAGTDGLPPAVIALATEGIKTMSLSKGKIAVLVLVLAGLAGAGMGWLGAARGKGGAEEEEAKARSAAEQRKGRDDRAGRLARVKDDLRDIAAEAETTDLKLSAEVVAARQRLMELEEKLLEFETGPNDKQIQSLRDEIALHEKEVESLLEKASKPDSPLAVSRRRIARKIDQLRALLADREKIARVAREERIDLRRKIIRLEEDLRLLERKRVAAREQAERRREEAAERLRRLEGGTVARRADRSLRVIERRLEAIQSEMAELRREVQRLRLGRKR
jgi:RNA polymerase sigma factor (sigma-70 family)